MTYQQARGRVNQGIRHGNKWVPRERHPPGWIHPFLPWLRGWLFPLVLVLVLVIVIVIDIWRVGAMSLGNSTRHWRFVLGALCVLCDLCG